MTNDWNVLGGGAEIYETVFVPAMMGEWASRGMALAKPQVGERLGCCLRHRCPRAPRGEGRRSERASGRSGPEL